MTQPASPKLSPFACDRVTTSDRSTSTSPSLRQSNQEPQTRAVPPVRSWLCLIERFCRRQLTNNLRKIAIGEIVLEYGDQSERFGDLRSSALMGHVHALDPRFFRRTVTGGALGAAESYLQGEWVSDDLTDLFRVLLKNEAVLEQFRSRVFSLQGFMSRLQHLRNRNSRSGSHRNIHEHYDLGNSFFSLFLDPTMMYSSGLFPSEQSSLQDASVEKVDRACRTLQLKPEDHLIEIGTGWGSFAIHAAGRYGCRVTTTTISEEQFRLSRQRIADAGLSDRITVLKQDYRDLSGQFDKLVSIEMIEAVGKQFLPQYFSTCDRLVRDNGAMLIQAITMPEQRYEQYKNSVDFIQKYIFPGGFLPSVSEMQSCVSQNSTFRMLGLHEFGLHYARTLRLWNERFHERLDEVRSQGFSERFIRMWRYYLCYCEAAFLERAIGVVQVLWAKPASTLGSTGVMG